MKKNLVFVVVIICLSVILSLTSCITLGTPSLPKPHSGNDTLLVVPVGRAPDSETGPYGNLRFYYEALPSADSESKEDILVAATPVERSTQLNAKYPMFGTVRYLKPGRYTLEAVRFVSEEYGYRGKRHNLQNIEFTVEPKEITVLPYRFIIDYTKPIKVYKAEDYYVYIVDTEVTDIQKLSEEEINRIEEELSSYNNVELWQSR